MIIFAKPIISVCVSCSFALLWFRVSCAYTYVIFCRTGVVAQSSAPQTGISWGATAQPPIQTTSVTSGFGQPAAAPVNNGWGSVPSSGVEAHWCLYEYIF